MPFFDISSIELVSTVGAFMRPINVFYPKFNLLLFFVSSFMISEISMRRKGFRAESADKGFFSCVSPLMNDQVRVLHKCFCALRKITNERSNSLMTQQMCF